MNTLLIVIAIISFIVRLWLEKDYGSKPLIVYMVSDTILLGSAYLVLLDLLGLLG